MAPFFTLDTNQNKSVDKNEPFDGKHFKCTNKVKIYTADYYRNLTKLKLANQENNIKENIQV